MYRDLRNLPKLQVLINKMVAERSVCCIEDKIVKYFGDIRSENAGMSSVKQIINYKNSKLSPKIQGFHVQCI